MGSPTREQRQVRVAAGSRRKRDLEAASNHTAVQAEKRRGREADLLPRVKQTRSAEFAWQLAVQWLSDNLSVNTMGLWIAPLTCRGEVDNGLYLSAPQSIHAWTERRYGMAIGTAIREVSDFKGAFFGLENAGRGGEWL